MEILIFLLKLSSNGFSYWEDASQLRKKKKKITQTWVAALIIWLFYCIKKDQND